MTTIHSRYGLAAALAAATMALSACGQSGGEAETAAEPAPAAATDEGEADMAGDETLPLGDWAVQLAGLEARAGIVADAAAIKRLQRSYGYYLGEGMWEDAANLFAEDGELEFGLDGVFRGPGRIAEYFRAYGGTEDGLAEGQLNEHFQLMPVIHIDPEGGEAEARWRDIILTGRLGEGAFWGEGPEQVRYVKEDGVWKIARLHWFDSVTVPYETGWLEAEDPTGGHFVEGLTPDAPPTVEYETWPGVYLPDFHFRNAQGETTASITGFAEPAPPSLQGLLDAVGEAPTAEALAQRAAVLAQEVELMEAENELENLQRIFGFYIDKNLWSDAAALFAEDAVLEWGRSGIYRGPESIEAYFATWAGEGPQEGVLNDHMQLMPVVHVAPDGLTAQGRFQGFNQTARHGAWARWSTGVYETDFVRDGGVWKIAAMRYYPTMITPYEDGWGQTALPMDEALEDPAPDSPPSQDYGALPEQFTPRFHYDHPVTGQGYGEGDPADHAEPADIETLQAQLVSLDRRIGLLTDRESAENLNAIYGYYLAHNQWDSLAGIFTEDGIIEIAMRGQYVGRDAVRRNLNLYGEQGGEQHGLLHNHMQYQPVIHVAPDGETAKMRSRAFSIMGSLGAYAQWAGGVYENDFEKVDGEWMIKRDQVFNTYFAPYDVGWKELNRREPPGISDDNPPDLPPSMDFEMYPSAFLPPFHYVHPVTGQPAGAPGAAD